jgi:sulfatase modifying factor 1
VILALVLLGGCGGDSKAPPGMILVPGGTFRMGRDHSPHLEEGPAHDVTLSPFFLDETLVTVADYRRYVEATGHVSVAEKLGYGMVSVEGMEDFAWDKVPGAHWRAPWGPDRPNPQADDHPVVSVAWNDARDYCEHAGKRLPTEAEWEYAMKAGSEGTRYPWGAEPGGESGELRLNYWQGRDHRRNDLKDGFLYTSPVRAFPPNAWGFYDPVGNVWQYTQDWYGAETFRHDAAGVTDPVGPPTGWARVARGGSWWCSPTSCSAYGLWARGKQQPISPYPNNGFRCAVSAR